MKITMYERKKIVSKINIKNDLFMHKILKVIIYNALKRITQSLISVYNSLFILQSWQVKYLSCKSLHTSLKLLIITGTYAIKYIDVFRNYYEDLH